MSDYDIETPVDDAPEAPVEEAPAAPVSDEWTPPSSEEEYNTAIQAAREEAAAQAYYEAISATQQPTAPEPGYDPYAPVPGADPSQTAPEWLEEDPQLTNWLGEQIQNGIAQGLEERLGDYQPILDMVAEEKGGQLAETFLNNVEQQIGEFDHSAAHLIATGLQAQGQEPAAALYNAALLQRQTEQALTQRAYEQYQNTLNNRESASAQPGVAGAASEIAELGDYQDIGARFVASIGRPTHAAG